MVSSLHFNDVLIQNSSKSCCTIHLQNVFFSFSVATSDIVVVWRGRANSYMQAIHGIFSVGAILSPFAAESFLAKKIILEATTAPAHTLAQSEVGAQEYTFNNVSAGEVLLDSAYGKLNKSETEAFMYGQSRIYVPYFVSTAICSAAAIFYIVVTLIYGSVYTKSIEVNSELVSVRHKEYFLSKKMKILFTLLLALTLTIYVMAERGFTNFLMTFLITELGWNKTEGSNASASFWITFALGRLSGIGIVKVLKLSYMILCFFLLLTMGGATLWVSVTYNQKAFVWVSIAVIGYGMSTTFASIFSWLSENVRRLTGKMASILFIFFSTGAMLFPILVGYLMDHVTQMWFVYTQVIMYFIIVIFFLFILILYRILEKANNISNKEVLK